LSPRGDLSPLPASQAVALLSIGVAAPTGFWRSPLWLLRGKPREVMKEIIGTVWPDYDAVILLGRYSGQSRSGYACWDGSQGNLLA